MGQEKNRASGPDQQRTARYLPVSAGRRLGRPIEHPVQTMRILDVWMLDDGPNVF